MEHKEAVETVSTPTATPTTTTSFKTFRDVLQSLVGKTLTIVNPESLEHGPLGQRVTANIYRGKVLALGEDFLKLQTVYAKAAKSEAEKEPVVQFIPIDRVKRISFMKSDTLLHI